MMFREDPESESRFHAMRRGGTGFYYRWRLCGASDFFNNIGGKVALTPLGLNGQEPPMAVIARPWISD
jgi:hypothetical protein